MRSVGALVAVGLALGAALGTALSSAAAVADTPTGDDGGRAPWVVGPALLKPMTKEIFSHLRERAPMVPEPKIESRNLAQEVQLFCSGAGVDTPDVLSMTRRMGVSEFQLCVKNGVADIIEVQVGMEALVLARRKQDADLPMTFDTFYRAIAAELPKGDDFLPNTAQTWHDLDPRLPKTEISVMVPSRATFSRPYFDNRFLQGACREIFEFKNIYSAEERVAQCIGLRRDGRVLELGLPITPETILAAMNKAPRGTVIVLSMRYAMEMADTFKVLPLEGVVPDRTTVSHQDYPATRSVVYYVKRAHVKDHAGNGPVLGLREFITEMTRESAIGDTGYLVQLGLVPLPEAKRAEVRRSALALSPMSR
ncbi:MAG: hypothetical protein H7840_06465 [Alphaproteobacteria bacterium]